MFKERDRGQTFSAETPMTLDLEELKRLEAAAEPGPWCIESVGEKGDGSNMIGVAFHPDDEEAQTPLAGWLKPFYDNGSAIEYYRDALVAVCDHSEPDANENAAFIAAARTAVPALIARVEELERQLAEARQKRVRKAIRGVVSNASYNRGWNAALRQLLNETILYDYAINVRSKARQLLKLTHRKRRKK